MISGKVWGATEAERDAPLPCDELEPRGLQTDRAISIDASPCVVYNWLCQLRVAPYSYDLLDNWGRPSPRERDPQLTELEAGQEFMSVFRLESFVLGRHITLVSGRIAVTYAVRPEGVGSRLVVRTRFGTPRIVGHLLAFGDVFMARKQLLTLRELAEAEAKRAATGTE
ncbi:hypothetical protein [Nocardia sp. NPDC050793]|uniref:hypothetical protein n=1 Tax=Nocardia sp. NPDC050793 TaxID=3155159 RepID=UPI0034077C10